MDTILSHEILTYNYIFIETPLSGNMIFPLEKLQSTDIIIEIFTFLPIDNLLKIRFLNKNLYKLIHLAYKKRFGYLSNFYQKQFNKLLVPLEHKRDLLSSSLSLLSFPNVNGFKFENSKLYIRNASITYDDLFRISENLNVKKVVISNSKIDFVDYNMVHYIYLPIYRVTWVLCHCDIMWSTPFDHFQKLYRCTITKV